MTYGTAAAPFLATNTLNSLAKEHEGEFPNAAEVLKSDFYVEYMLTGTSNLADAIKYKDMNELLRRGGFNLRKWCSNDSSVLKGIPNK